MGYMTEEAAQNLADTEVEVVDWLTASGTVFNGVMADGFGYGLYHSEANVSLAYGANHPISSPKHPLRAPRELPRWGAVLSPVQPQLHPSQFGHRRG